MELCLCLCYPVEGAPYPRKSASTTLSPTAAATVSYAWIEPAEHANDHIVDAKNGYQLCEKGPGIRCEIDHVQRSRHKLDIGEVAELRRVAVRGQTSVGLSWSSVTVPLSPKLVSGWPVSRSSFETDNTSVPSLSSIGTVEGAYASKTEFYP